MIGSDSVFAGSIPALYERFMVPMLFQPYADDLAKRVADAGPATVLETAAGTGVVTRAMLKVLPATARLTATDLNPAMLEIAKGASGDDDRVAWQQADALALPFPDRSFDLVACQFGVMFFPDKVTGFRQARRVLKPGGRFIFNVWDGLAANDFVRVLSTALDEVFPENPSRFMERTPHGYHDLERIAAELAAAGFSDVGAVAVDAVSRVASARDAATAYCQGSPLRSEIEARGGNLEEVTAIGERALVAAFGSGAVEGRIRAYVISATA